jgi:hypothetical protein
MTLTCIGALGSFLLAGITFGYCPGELSEDHISLSFERRGVALIMAGSVAVIRDGLSVVTAGAVLPAEPVSYPTT